MPKTTTPQPFSDNSWFSSSKYTPSSSSFYSNKKNEDTSLNNIISAVDESPEFYDPYSDLNLFLSQKIKQYLRFCHSSKKWNSKIQEELLERITPEFQQVFPKLRLGVPALKKTWEKVLYYYEQIQQHEEALTKEGELNIHFFIRENLKNYISMRCSLLLHPSHFAQQLAAKLGECIASINAEKPKIDRLTKLIWSIQRHLLICKSAEELKSPYDENDPIDQLIVRNILELTAMQTQMDYREIERQVRENIPVTSDEVERKIHAWSVQGDMLYRSVRLDTDSKLLCHIRQKFEQVKGSCYSHESFVNEICQATSASLKRVWILYKHVWYTAPSLEEESSYDRFLKWHALSLSEMPLSLALVRLEEIVRTRLPLVPYDAKRAESILQAFGSRERCLGE